MEAGFESAHSSQIEGQKIKKQSAVGFRGQGNHLALLILSGVIVNPLQVGGFSAQTWTVVHQLAINFARRKIDEGHCSLALTRPQIYSIHGAGEASIRGFPSPA